MIKKESDELVLAVATAMATGVRRCQLVAKAQADGSFMGISAHISAAERTRAVLTIEDSLAQGLTIVTIWSADYPEVLRAIDAPPPVLFVRSKGATSLAQLLCIGVVGTRAASVDMCQRASDTAQDLALAGCTIVSGLALGIDGAAHRGALRAPRQCSTVAVLAHGLDRVYPPSHEGLARQIVDQGGCLISEYPPSTEPMKHHFLARNRIIAGLSQGIVVVEAGARSGSLVTAQFAADYGRDVFVLATQADDARNSGGISMIEQGALAICSAADVLREYGIHSAAEQAGCSWIEVDVTEFAEANRYSRAQLLEMEIAGEIIRLSGNRARIREDRALLTKNQQALPAAVQSLIPES